MIQELLPAAAVPVLGSALQTSHQQMRLGFMFLRSDCYKAENSYIMIYPDMIMSSNALILCRT
jgi:hypothetical protein